MRLHARAWNPLAMCQSAASGSSYFGLRAGILIPYLDPELVPEDTALAVHEQLRNTVLRNDFPCLGARASFHRGLYRFGVYSEIGSALTARSVCHDLYEFAHELQDPNAEFATFIAIFLGPRISSESHFERRLWAQLQLMHGIDAQFFAWDRDVSRDPENPWFSFSIGGHAYYIVGLHNRASRLARQFPHPTLVFNLHTQFALLRERGKLESFKKTIRARDIALQGSINPTLIKYASGSQARQYSGRAVEPDWRCPFRPTEHDA
jgi:FPC/CPF motif-containing protein YcgG